MPAREHAPQPEVVRTRISAGTYKVGTVRVGAKTTGLGANPEKGEGLVNQTVKKTGGGVTGSPRRERGGDGLPGTPR
jgi:hypothetical protein